MTTTELLSHVRHLYKEVSDYPAKIVQFRAFIAELPDEVAILRLAYQAAAVALKARETWFPWEKLAHFQKSMEIFNEALAYQTDEIEVRFLRYTIQKNTPFILGLGTHIVEDKKCILDNIKKSPTDMYMKESIAAYLLKNEYLTAQEKAVLTDLSS